jgi:hypothetical protein
MAETACYLWVVAPKNLNWYSLAKLATDEHVRVQAQTPFRRTVPSRTITTSIAWRSLRNHRAATCSRRYVRPRLARAGHPALCVLACQSRWGDVPASVVRSIARSSLFGGALADIFTSAGPSPPSLLPSCGISRPCSCCLADPRNFEPALLLFVVWASFEIRTYTLV